MGPALKFQYNKMIANIEEMQRHAEGGRHYPMPGEFGEASHSMYVCMSQYDNYLLYSLIHSTNIF